MGARLGEVLKRHYEIISHHRIAVKIKKPEDIRFLKAFFGGSMWESNPQKSFTIKSYINIIEVFMRFYRILFFLQESKNTILIIKVCYKVCYFFTQKIARLPIKASGTFLFHHILCSADNITESIF